MSQIKYSKCDQCGKIELDDQIVANKWISIESVFDDLGETTKIHYYDKVIEFDDEDFCSKECLIKYILGEPNVK